MRAITAVVLGLCLTASAQAAPVTGIYDENVVATNSVDFVASGSSLTDAQFAANVFAAYGLDFGGVIDASVLAGAYEYGISGTKTLQFGAVDGTNWGIGTPGTDRTISGTGAFASTDNGGYDFTSLAFLGILNGLPDEYVVEFGVTALSLTDRDYGDVTVVARLASGATLAATRSISEANGQGDTFYGFTAPAGDYFAGFSLAYDGAVVPDFRLWFDDIGFRTAVVTAVPAVPEPSTLVLMATGAVGVALSRRRRWQRTPRQR